MCKSDLILHNQVALYVSIQSPKNHMVKSIKQKNVLIEIYI